MRCRTILIPMCEVCHLDLNYNYLLMSAILDVIRHDDPSTSEMLHSLDSHKPMTFSRLFVRNYTVKGSRLFIYAGSTLSFILSSPLENVIESYIKGALSRERMRIGDVEFFIKSVQILDDPAISESHNFVLLSPLVISVPQSKGGKIYHRYLGPTDEEFKERFGENLKRKYETLIGKDPKGDVEIIPDMEYIKKKQRTSKLIDIKGTKIRGHIFPFKLVGDPSLIKLGYDAGFGERTAQGFGCAEVKG